MNFDKIQEQWNNENVENISLPENLEKYKDAQNPIDKVRKNMRGELVTQVICVILIVFFPMVFKNFTTEILFVFLIFYIMMLGFGFYYGLKFYKFYKRSYNLSYDSRKNLMWFSFELKMFIELYRALNFIMLFLGFGFGFYFITKLNMQHFLHIIISETNYIKLILILLSVIAIPIGLIIFLTEIWINYGYGKYLKKINKILDELDAE